MAGNSVLGILFNGYALAYLNVSLETINVVFNVSADDKAAINGLLTGKAFVNFSFASDRSSLWSFLSWTNARCSKSIKGLDSDRSYCYSRFIVGISKQFIHSVPCQSGHRSGRRTKFNNCIA